MIFAFLDGFKSVTNIFAKPVDLISHKLSNSFGLPEEEKPLHVLKTVFDYEEFRAGQLEAIQTISNGDDCYLCQLEDARVCYMSFL